MVEFALVMPLLLILLLGIIEFGYLLGEYNDVRHGAREGARIAAVSGAPSSGALHIRTCESMDLTTGSMDVQFAAGSSDVGATRTVTITATVSSLSGLGLIEVFLPNTLQSSVEFRLEQPATWVAGDASGVCP